MCLAPDIWASTSCRVALVSTGTGGTAQAILRNSGGDLRVDNTARANGDVSGSAYASGTGIIQEAQSGQFVSVTVLNGGDGNPAAVGAGDGLIDVHALASANGDYAAASAYAVGISQDAERRFWNRCRK